MMRTKKAVKTPAKGSSSIGDAEQAAIAEETAKAIILFVGSFADAWLRYLIARRISLEQVEKQKREERSLEE
jgi:hypothetical protein